MRFLLVVALVPVVVFAQSKKQRKALEAQRKADQQIIANLETHDAHLSATTGDASAANYLSTQFATIGLKPAYNNNYSKTFTIDNGRKPSAANYLKINEHELSAEKDYVPLCYSGSKKLSAMPAMALREKGVPWFASLEEIESKDSTKNIHQLIKGEANRAAARGATALFVYNTAADGQPLTFDGADTSAPVTIPVVFIKKDGYRQYLSDKSAVLDIDMNIGVEKWTGTAQNTAGFIDNNAAATIVVTAPYCSGVNKINNDSTSAATAKPCGGLLIELAKMIAASPRAKQHNYLFVAVDTTFKGAPFDDQSTRQPVDLCVALNSAAAGDNAISISGKATSPSWAQTVKSVADKTVNLSIDTIAAEANDRYAYPAQLPVVSFAASQPVAGQEYANQLQLAKLVYRFIEASDPATRLSLVNVGVKSALSAAP